MKADYHFHPNLHAKNTEKRLWRIWQAFAQAKLDAVVCTEHTYKNAKSAYQKLAEARPSLAHTHVFPGAELISRDGKGVEIVAFAKDEWYDSHPKLLQPLTMSFFDMVAYLRETDLTWFIPHPFILGSPLRKLFPNTNELQSFLKTVPAIEAHNGCYLLLERLYRAMPGHWLNTTQADKLQQSVQLPDAHQPSGPRQFVAVGSDAHHPRDVGFAVNIKTDVDTSDRQQVFNVLTTNTAIEDVVVPPQTLSLRHLLYTAWTTFSESSMKREWRRYEYQHSTLNRRVLQH